LSRLSQASLRINESLDFDEVLQGVLDSARSLTAARYGVMTLLDDAGRVQDFLSSGMTSEEAERLWLTPERWQLFQALTGVSEPLRIPDLVEHVRALGFDGFSIPLPVGVFRFMAAPMFHRGVRVGHVFVGDRDGGGEFSRADEETLVMFASQAALVIANARTHREERQPGRTWRPWSTPPRWVSWSSTPGPEGWCRSTGRLGASWTGSGRGTRRRRTCWRW
jgi:GAF domain-containing protein